MEMVLTRGLGFKEKNSQGVWLEVLESARKLAERKR
jgi:hypothetical protein